MIDLKNLPSDPGCYIFKDKDNVIIYIGKAKSLKKRVKSYFQKTEKDEKTKRLVKDICDVEFFATSNEVEALILESNLIKKHRPMYNINLKDSHRYAFIQITDEEYPRIMVARDKTSKGRYYGPFVSGELRDRIVKVLRSSFLIRTCKKLPKRECLRFHINLCSAPCINHISKIDYIGSVKNAEIFLKGKVKTLVKKLTIDMTESSRKLAFENAKNIRDQIFALESLEEKQKFELDKRYDEDIINYIVDGKNVYLIVFNISRGVLATKNEFTFEFTKDFFEEFITQYYSESKVPKELIVPQNLKDESFIGYLEELRGGSVRINIPKIGDKFQLLNLVKRNIEIAFLQESQMVTELRDSLKLNSDPYVIECFDISNISGTNIVGSMVQFRGAKPDKTNYRRFKVRTVVGSDDFASIYEVVKRRYARLKADDKEMPDLIVVDGGKGQLSAATGALKELELKIPIISLAKKFEEIYAPGRPIPVNLKKDSKGLKLLMQIRDEAHRFAIKYHRLLRSKEMIKED